MIKENELALCHCENVAEPRQHGSHQELSAMAKVMPEARQYVSKWAAFTLAEVLITLGIIGVVAAVTIPTLNKNIQHKILEVRFKKSLATLQMIVTNTRANLQTDSLYQYCYNSGPNDCTAAITEQILLLSDAKMCEPSYYIRCSVERNNGDIATYNGKNYLDNKDIIWMFPYYYVLKLRDGSFVGVWKHGYNHMAPYLAVDTNGYEKPNKLGHDIFKFTINSKDKIVYVDAPNNAVTDEQAETMYANSSSINKNYYISTVGNPCNTTSARKGNGLGCAYYVLQNKCPWDNTKTYWECLP